MAQPIPGVEPARGGAGRSIALTLAAVVVVALVAVVVVMVFVGAKGSLVVTVAGPGNKPIDSLQVIVDGRKVCEASPCLVSDLKKGTHYVKVLAAGYQATADQAVAISRGESVLNLTLTRASEGTGIRVTADGTGLKLFLNGKEVGPLPQELKDMTPGTHKIRVEGERYEPHEETVTVKADQMLSIEPKLKVQKGLVTIKPGTEADDVSVFLVSGRERRPIPKLPIKVELSADKPYTIVATRKGFAEFSERITFEDGQAEKTYVINMSPATESAPVAAGPGPAPRSGGGAAPAPAPGPAPAPRTDTQAAAAMGTLNLNSIPVSNVILDGRPLGPTPKVGISVKAGPHTIVFVHAEHGRKVRTVNVPAGKTVTEAVRFP